MVNFATLDPLSAKSDFPLCNQNHVNLNLQTPVVSHFVLWLWHTRKMWLDGRLIQTIYPSQATACQTSMKSELGITNLFSKWLPATTHSKWEDFHKICLVSPIHLFLSPYSEAVPKMLQRVEVGFDQKVCVETHYFTLPLLQTSHQIPQTSVYLLKQPEGNPQIYSEIKVPVLIH